MTAEEIFDHDGTDLDAIREVLKFAADYDLSLKPQPQAITGQLRIDDHQFELVISPWTAGHALHISHRNGNAWSHFSEGIWETVRKARELRKKKWRAFSSHTQIA